MKNPFIIWGIAGLTIATIAFINKNIIMETAKKVYEKFTRSAFIETFKDALKSSTKGTGLFPSVMMAQAILESNNGNSSLSREAFNFFGIKADKSWSGSKVDKPTTEYINGQPVKVSAYFRKYNSATSGFKDRNDFLKKNSRYAKAGVFTAKTPEDQARALQAAGYATDPSYASLLINLINSNNLKSLDS